MYRKIKNIFFDNWRKQSVIAITLTCLLINAFTITLYVKNKDVNESKDWVIHSYETLRQARMVLNHVQDMEIGQRGFFLSDNDKYLKPYERSRVKIIEQFERLREMLEDNPVQFQRLSELEKAARAHDSLLNDQIIKFKSKKYTITVRDLEQSSILLEEIKSKLYELRDEELRLLKIRQMIERRKQDNYIKTIIAGSLLAIVGLILANTVIIYQSRRRLKVEQQLRRSEEIYTIVTQGINEGVYDYNLKENKIFFSSGFKTMLGYNDNEFPNDLEFNNELIHPEDIKKVWDVVHDYINGEGTSYRNIFRMRHKDGHFIWILSRGVGLYDEHGTMVQLVGTHTDITEQKEREEYLKQLNTELENFTYITSHDLRSPLVNLKGFSAEMQTSLNELKEAVKECAPRLSKKHASVIERVTEVEFPEALTYIKTSVERLDQLTSAILDLSRIGRRELRTEHIDVKEMVKKIFTNMAYEINSKKVEIQLGDLPDLSNDRIAMQQVFSNIIENAVKYLDDKRPGLITVSGHETPGGEIEYQISDNGRGIAEHDRHRVFDMFKRARNVAEVRGVGMGMAFVKTTVQRIGGKIWFESTLDSGTKFIFTVPNRITKGSKDAG